MDYHFLINTQQDHSIKHLVHHVQVGIFLVRCQVITGLALYKYSRLKSAEYLQRHDSTWEQHHHSSLLMNRENRSSKHFVAVYLQFISCSEYRAALLRSPWLLIAGTRNEDWTFPNDGCQQAPGRTCWLLWWSLSSKELIWRSSSPFNELEFFYTSKSWKMSGWSVQRW